MLMPIIYRERYRNCYWQAITTLAGPTKTGDGGGGGVIGGDRDFDCGEGTTAGGGNGLNLLLFRWLSMFR